MRRALQGLTLLLVGTGMLAVAGCGQGGVGSSLGGEIITPTLQSDLTAALPQVIGPAQSYSVTISGLDTTGHANEVDITGINMQPSGAPVIASMSAQFLDVNFSESQDTITHVGLINMNLNVTAADLTTFVVNTKGIPDTVVTLTAPDQLGVTGNANVTGLGQVSLAIQGDVVPAGADVNYVLNTVEANGNAVTDTTLLGEISALYNPLVDLSGIPAHPTISFINVSNNVMNIVATGFFP